MDRDSYINYVRACLECGCHNIADPPAQRDDVDYVRIGRYIKSFANSFMNQLGDTGVGDLIDIGKDKVITIVTDKFAEPGFPNSGFQGFLVRSIRNAMFDYNRRVNSRSGSAVIEEYITRLQLTSENDPWRTLSDEEIDSCYNMLFNSSIAIAPIAYTGNEVPVFPVYLDQNSAKQYEDFFTGAQVTLITKLRERRAKVVREIFESAVSRARIMLGADAPKDDLRVLKKCLKKIFDTVKPVGTLARSFSSWENVRKNLDNWYKGNRAAPRILFEREDSRDNLINFIVFTEAFREGASRADRINTVNSALDQVGYERLYFFSYTDFCAMVTIGLDLTYADYAELYDYCMKLEAEPVHMGEESFEQTGTFTEDFYSITAKGTKGGSLEPGVRTAYQFLSDHRADMARTHVTSREHLPGDLISSEDPDEDIWLSELQDRYRLRYSDLVYPEDKTVKEFIAGTIRDPNRELLTSFAPQWMTVIFNGTPCAVEEIVKEYFERIIKSAVGTYGAAEELFPYFSEPEWSKILTLLDPEGSADEWYARINRILRISENISFLSALFAVKVKYRLGECAVERFFGHIRGKAGQIAENLQRQASRDATRNPDMLLRLTEEDLEKMVGGNISVSRSLVIGILLQYINEERLYEQFLQNSDDNDTVAKNIEAAINRVFSGSGEITDPGMGFAPLDVHAGIPDLVMLIAIYNVDYSSMRERCNDSAYRRNAAQQYPYRHILPCVQRNSSAFQMRLRSMGMNNEEEMER